MNSMQVPSEIKVQASQAIRTVQESLAGLGRIAYEQNNVDYLLWAVAMAGDGDHLEIGVLHGGSLVASALLKQRLGLSGNFTGIDPFDGYYTSLPRWASKVDPVSGFEIHPGKVAALVERCEIRSQVDLICRPSIPFPTELLTRKFVSAFIDGDHWTDAPWQDWLHVKQITTRYVIFDNDDDGHPAVKHACDEAGKDSDWKIVLRQDITCILEKQS